MTSMRIPAADEVARDGRSVHRIALGLLLLIAVALQSTVFTSATILGVVPQLVLVVVVSVAFLEGEHTGAAAGFAGGLLIDLLSPGHIVGLTAFLYTVLGHGVGRASDYAIRGSLVAPVVLVAVGSAATEAAYSFASVLLGRPWVGIGDTFRIATLVVLYNTLLAPFVYPTIRRILRRLERDRVVSL